MSVAKLGPEQHSFKTKQETGEKYDIIEPTQCLPIERVENVTGSINAVGVGGQTGLLFIIDELTVWSLPSHLTLEDFCISHLFT